MSNKKKSYKARLKESELFFDEAKKEATDLVNDIEILYDKTDKEGLLEKKEKRRNDIEKLEKNS